MSQDQPRLNTDQGEKGSLHTRLWGRVSKEDRQISPAGMDTKDMTAGSMDRKSLAAPAAPDGEDNKLH